MGCYMKSTTNKFAFALTQKEGGNKCRVFTFNIHVGHNYHTCFLHVLEIQTKEKKPE